MTIDCRRCAHEGGCDGSICRPEYIEGWNIDYYGNLLDPDPEEDSDEEEDEDEEDRQWETE